MLNNGRVASLMAQKAQLEAELHQETARKAPDQFRLSTLKRRKLQVKEQLSQLIEA